ncbi:MAG: hypothetical protein AAGI88_00050 [Pseudomonadota bacterium]
MAQAFFGCELPTLTGKANTRSEDIMALVDIMRPQASPAPLIRIGGGGDGAYLLPDDLAGIRACFSPGVCNMKPFEDELARSHGIRSHMCDFSSDSDSLFTPLIEGMQTFEKRWLDLPGTPDSTDLNSWISDYYPDTADDLMLQIDIEGAEYRNILHAPPETLGRFRVIVMELHALDQMRERAVAEAVFEPFFKKLDEQFICVHAHANNWRGDWRVPGTTTRVPMLLELTFLRRDRFDAPQGKQPEPVLLPHPLDIVNVANKDPLYLDESWLNGPRPMASRMHIVEQRIGRLPDRETEGVLNSLPALLAQTNQAIANLRAETLPRPEGSLTELATGKPFTTSSTVGWMKGKGEVQAAETFFFHTLPGLYESITIDFLSEHPLYTLEIENRQDMCQERARFLFYVTHSEPQPDLTRAFPVCADANFVSKPPSISRTDIGGVKVRYLTIFSGLNSHLHLAAIRVYGYAFSALS